MLLVWRIQLNEGVCGREEIKTGYREAPGSLLTLLYERGLRLKIRSGDSEDWRDGVLGKLSEAVLDAIQLVGHMDPSASNTSMYGLGCLLLWY